MTAASVPAAAATTGGDKGRQAGDTGIARLRRLLDDHARYAWDEEAQALVAASPVNGVSHRNVDEVEGGLWVVDDVPFDPDIAPSRIDCCGHELALLHPFAPSQLENVTTDEQFPWLLRNRRGGRILAFNLLGFVDRFICFGEERAIEQRDRHGRLPFAASTLRRWGVAHLPLLNGYFFALLAVAKARGAAPPAIDPASHVLPPVIVLSHDCDQLHGNDVFTQGSRLLRFLRPLTRLRPPDARQVKSIVGNLLAPRRNYFDDALAMSRLERQLGFRSAFYFLNGKGGRFGARSGSRIIADFVQQLPPDAELGVHYNYGLAGSADGLRRQIDELQRLAGRSIRSGRAHYLKIDPERDWTQLRAAGIAVDESLGFAECNSFRVGFAGAFSVPCAQSDGESVTAIPLHFMDTNTVPRNDAHDMMSMAQAVERFGGVITVLYHPGAFDTEEAPQLRGVYPAMLRAFAERGYRPMLPSELGQLLGDG